MKNEGFELSTKQLKILLTICVFCVLAYIVYTEIFRTKTTSTENDFLKYVKSEDYAGVVYYKDYDKNNHNNPTLYFKNKSQITINGEFWSKIKVGDSLVKKKGETIITIFRNREKITLDNKDILSNLKKN